MSKAEQLRRHWRAAGEDLGFEIIESFKIELPSGDSIVVPVFVPHFGAERGMLIVSAIDDLGESLDELVGLGYGYSSMAEPREDEEYERDAFLEILADWGWSGESSVRPVWLAAP